MLYQFYETQRSLMEPFADLAQTASKVFANPKTLAGQNPFAQRISAGYDLIHRLGKDYVKPDSQDVRILSGDLNHFGNRCTNVVNVLAVERGHAHASSIGAVNTKFIAQAHHLVFGEARVAEHADLAGDE